MVGWTFGGCGDGDGVKGVGWRMGHNWLRMACDGPQGVFGGQGRERGVERLGGLCGALCG